MIYALVFVLGLPVGAVIGNYLGYKTQHRSHPETHFNWRALVGHKTYSKWSSTLR